MQQKIIYFKDFFFFNIPLRHLYTNATENSSPQKKGVLTP